MHTRLSATSFGTRMTAAGSGGFSGKADVRKAKLHRERFRDLLFSGEIHPDEDDTQPLAGALVLDQRVFEIVVADEARLDQALTDFLAQSEPRPAWALWLEGSTILRSAAAGDTPQDSSDVQNREWMHNIL